MNNQPVISTRDRGLSISIFEREKDGQKTYGACLQRSWKDKNTDEWKREQINLFPDELLKIANLAQKTYNELMAYLQKNRPASSGNYPSQSYDNSDGWDNQAGASSPADLNDDIPF